MSRSGLNEADFYSVEDVLQYGRFRGQIQSAIRGKRGQGFFQAVVEALDAMPEMVTSDYYQDGGERVYDSIGDKDGNVCVLGALAMHRGLPTDLDAEDHSKLGETFNIAHQLAQEVMYMNDEYFDRGHTPEQRWTEMRAWALSKIRQTSD